MNRTGCTQFLAVVVVVLIPLDVCQADDGPSGGGTAEPIAQGTSAMAERLEQIARGAGPEEFHWNNAARAEYFRAKVPRATNLRDAVIARMQLAYELLWAGSTADAIHEFTELRRFFDQPNVGSDPRLERLVKRLREGLPISHLRLAEQENCIAHHTIDSCLMPISGTGVHLIQRGSRAAIKELRAALELEADDLGARWLLNLAYMTLGEYPDAVPQRWLIPPTVFASDYPLKRFLDAAPRLGLDIVGLAGGSIIEDFNGDGYLDIMASSWGLRDQLRYLQNNGDGTFTELTAHAGLLGEVGGLNLSHADYDNDGHSDVLVLRGAWLFKQGRHPNSLLRNNGNGTFEDVTELAGLLSFHPTQVGVWGDYDNDGWVDLFIGNESFRGNPHPCQLFHNNADGTFTDVASAAGVDISSFVKGAAWGDYNNDGLLDLYVSCFLQENVLFRNEGRDETGRWKFRDVGKEAGVTEPLASFPTWFWDYDNDGWLDIFVGSFAGVTGYSLPDVAADYLDLPTSAERPRLYRNQHDGTFADVTKAARLDVVLLAMGANYGDLDNDGFLDVYIGTGEPDLRTLVPNRMFRNNGGRFFQDVTTSGGFGHLQKGHGISFGDIDNDGDQDIYAVMGGFFSGDVFQNVLFENPGNDNHWITIQLEGVASNRAALGARVKLTVGGPDGARRDIYSTVSTGGSFGASCHRLEIGLGNSVSIESLEVRWPATNAVQTFRNVKMDQFLMIREGDPEPVQARLKKFQLRGSAAATHTPHVAR